VRDRIADDIWENFRHPEHGNFVQSRGSTVAIQGGEMITLGVLIKDNPTATRTRTSYLQDIPVVGNAFREDTDNIVSDNVFAVSAERQPAAQNRRKRLPDAKMGLW